MKTNGLCFYCLGKHFARYCNHKQPCEKCKGGHTELLHLKAILQGSPATSRKANENKSDQRSREESCINVARYPQDEQPPPLQFTASVPLIALTAIKNSADKTESNNEVVFYALLDAGADVSIAESLYGWTLSDTIGIRFLEKSPDEYYCMKRTLRLKYGESQTVELHDVPFIDARLPYSQCIPDQAVLDKYGLTDDCFSWLQRRQRVDMILGAQDIRRFQVLILAHGRAEFLTSL